MNVLDTDVVSNFFKGRADVVKLVESLSQTELALTIVTCEELIRGWLAAIRHAEAGKSRVTLPEAYLQFSKILTALNDFTILPYTPAAAILVKAWSKAKIKGGGTQDFRIAATCVIHNVKLITHNGKDFQHVPELKLSVWN